MYVAVLEHAAKIERTLKVDGCAAFICENLDVWFAQYCLKNRKVMVIYASSLALLSHCYPYGEMAPVSSPNDKEPSAFNISHVEYERYDNYKHLYKFN